MFFALFRNCSPLGKSAYSFHPSIFFFHSPIKSSIFLWNFSSLYCHLNYLSLNLSSSYWALNPKYNPWDSSKWVAKLWIIYFIYFNWIAKAGPPFFSTIETPFIELDHRHLGPIIIIGQGQQYGSCWYHFDVRVIVLYLIWYWWWYPVLL